MQTENDAQPNRRDLLKGVSLGAGWAAGLPLTLPATTNAAESPSTTHENAPDFTKSSAALEPDRIVASACQFCNSLCRLQVHLKAGRVIDVKGEENDPVQAGELCVKAALM